jgi:chaperonin GroES
MAQKEHTMTVKIGDSVLYGKYSGTELKLEGKDYLIMREEIFLQLSNTAFDY